MGDEPKVIPGHVGYSPDYKGESPRHVSGVVVVTDEMLRGPPIDIPAIMRAGGFEEGVKAERTRIVAQLRTWRESIVTGMSLAPTKADMCRIETLGEAADAIASGETEPTWAK